MIVRLSQVFCELVIRYYLKICHKFVLRSFVNQALDFIGARDDGVAIASARPYANHLHLAPDR